MTMRYVHRSISTPLRESVASLPWHELWCGPDHGMISCWEAGREMRAQHPALAARAERGELVPLPWKGGTHNVQSGVHKHGVLQYLAMWQGLRGEDLDIDLEGERAILCSKTGVRVVFQRTVVDEAEESLTSGV